MSIYNKSFTSEKWDKVCKYNKDLLEDYLLELRSQKKSKGTIRTYGYNLRLVLIYIYDNLNNKEIYKLEKRNFRDMMLYFQDIGLSSNRMNNIKSPLKSMLAFAEDNNDYKEITVNHVSKLRSITKEPVKEIIFLTDEEIKFIYDTLKEQKRYKEALLCAILYDSAGRENEFVQLKRNDIIEGKTITTTVVTSKRNKKFKLIYNARTIEAYKLYENNRRDNLNSLFVNSNGKPANKNNIYRWVKSWKGLLGYQKDFNVHSFRHSAIENLYNGSHYIAKALNKKFNLVELQLLAHHDSIETTQKYLKDNSEEQLLQLFTLV